MTTASDSMRTAPLRRAVVFGAGKMAGGLIGHVLSRSGFAVQFVARRAEVIEAINRHRGYRLTIAGRPPLRIRGCSALALADRARVTSAVANAELVFTAVGIDNLDAVTGAIAAALTYNEPGDAQAVALQQTIASDSLEHVLTEDCGLLPHEQLARTVKHHWRVLVAERVPQSTPVHTPAPLQESIQALVSDLSLERDPRLVWDALARVVQQRSRVGTPARAVADLAEVVAA